MWADDKRSPDSDAAGHDDEHRGAGCCLHSPSLALLSKSYDAGTNVSIWTYRMTKGTSTINSAIIAIPASAVPVDASHNGARDTDHLGLSGVKFPQALSSSTPRTMWFKLTGDWTTGAVNHAMKVSTNYTYTGTTTGPASLVAAPDRRRG